MPARAAVRGRLPFLVLLVLLTTCVSDQSSAPPPPRAVTSPHAYASTNLLLDPGFEAGGSGWQGVDSLGRGLDNAQVHSGGASQRISATSLGSRVVYQDVSVTAGSTYDASGWVASDGLSGGEAALDILWLDASGFGDSVPPQDILGTEQVGMVNGTNDWTDLSGSFTSPAGTVVARVQLRVAPEPTDLGTGWFDDLAFAEKPPLVEITFPAEGSNISGVMEVTANVSDPALIAGVQFKMNGANLGLEVTAPPYQVALNAYTLPEGPVTFSAVARDTAGNLTPSAVVNATVANPVPRDVLVIMTDDQRYDSYQYLPLTSALLGPESITFSNAFVSTPLCCPSRASILTGLYSHNTGVYNNNLPNGGATKFNPTSTVATWLHQAGYRTSMIGKYLNDYAKISPSIPPGWDDFQVFRDFLNGDNGYTRYTLAENGVIHTYSGMQDYSTNLLANRAVSFINSTPARQPMMLFFTEYAPHDRAIPYSADLGSFASMPLWRPPAYNETDVSDKANFVKNLPLISTARRVASDSFHQRIAESLRAADRGISSVITALQQSGRWANTLVIFLSDNGLSWGEHRILDNKACPYEECIHVPFLLKVPGIPARQDASLVSNIDIAPTIAEWAGVVPPGKVNGSSLLPLANNPGTSWRTEILFEQLGFTAAQNFRGVRTSRYVYISFLNNQTEFYDLATDPFQLTNVVKKSQYASVVASLRQILLILKAS
jgi:N-acetylglucosamine-6-sulfatase